jgi:hypothetical protein
MSKIKEKIIEILQIPLILLIFIKYYFDLISYNLKKFIMQDLIARLTSWKTTIIGVATLLIALLVMFGVIKTENQAGAVEHIGTFWDSLVQILASISGLILIFSHDAPPKV